MSKKIIIPIVVAFSFMLIGAIAFVGVMSFLSWDFMALNTASYETNVYTINEQFENISINTNTVDVSILKSYDGTCKIECVEYKRENHNVSVKDNTLNIDLIDTREWHDHITVFEFGSAKINVYLPQDKYNEVKVSVTTGDLEILDNFVFGNIEIKGTTSDIDLSNITADNMDVSLTTGDVELDRCDANEIYIKTSTGDVEGSLLSDKIFICSTTTGDIDVPQATNGGRCEIVTTTGDIDIEIIK